MVGNPSTLDGFPTAWMEIQPIGLVCLDVVVTIWRGFVKKFLISYSVLAALVLIFLVQILTHIEKNSTDISAIYAAFWKFAEESTDVIKNKKAARHLLKKQI